MLSLKRPRSRTVKWLGTLLTAAMLIIWISSGWWYARVIIRQRYAVAMTGGLLWVSNGADFPSFDPLEVYGPSDIRFRFMWGFDYSHRHNPATRRMNTTVAIPLWSFVLIGGVPTLLLWQRDWKRSRPGLCKSCGYDLRGADHTVCPECGAAIKPTQAAIK